MVEKNYTVGTAAAVALVTFALGIIIGYSTRNGPFSTAHHTVTRPLGAPSADPPTAVTLLGIDINQPLTLPKCENADLELLGKNGVSGAFYHGAITCYWEFHMSKTEEAKFAAAVDPAFRTSNNYNIEMPFASKPSYITSIDVTSLHGKVAMINIDTNGEEGQEQAFIDLKTKFGAPTETDANHLQNGFGARYEGINAAWHLMPQNVTVELQGIGSLRGHGHMTVKSQSFLDAEEALASRNPSPHL